MFTHKNLKLFLLYLPLLVLSQCVILAKEKPIPYLDYPTSATRQELSLLNDATFSLENKNVTFARNIYQNLIADYQLSFLYVPLLETYLLYIDTTFIDKDWRLAERLIQEANQVLYNLLDTSKEQRQTLEDRLRLLTYLTQQLSGREIEPAALDNLAHILTVFQEHPSKWIAYVYYSIGLYHQTNANLVEEGEQKTLSLQKAKENFLKALIAANQFHAQVLFIDISEHVLNTLAQLKDTELLQQQALRLHYVSTYYTGYNSTAGKLIAIYWLYQASSNAEKQRLYIERMKKIVTYLSPKEKEEYSEYITPLWGQEQENRPETPSRLKQESKKSKAPQKGVKKSTLPSKDPETIKEDTPAKPKTGNKASKEE